MNFEANVVNIELNICFFFQGPKGEPGITGDRGLPGRTVCINDKYKCINFDENVYFDYADIKVFLILFGLVIFQGRVGPTGSPGIPGLDGERVSFSHSLLLYEMGCQGRCKLAQLLLFFY